MIGESSIHFGSLVSTNDYLKEHSYLSDGTVITADYQTKGRGRQSSVWESARFQNILMSVLLKPEIVISQTPMITQIASVAICEVLERHNIAAEIKWPNDVLVNGKKIAGILVESSVKGTELEYVILGIGFNINQSYFRHLSDVATSMKREGVQVHVEDVTRELIQVLNKYYYDFLKGHNSFRERYNYFKMKEV